MRRFSLGRVLAVAVCSGAITLAGCSRNNAPQNSEPPGTVHPQEWPALAPPIARDEALEARIEELLASLTLEQKVGQLIQADVANIKPEELRQYPLGAVLNGGNSGPWGNDLAPAEDWLKAADAYYEAARESTPIPIMWGTDAVHGHNNIIGATIFPHNIGLGATRNPELIRRIGEITAREVTVTGQEWTFGPTLAVVRDDRWGRSYESYSEDPEIVAQYASAMTLGLQGEAGSPEFLGEGRLIATAKHFLGDGGTAGGKDQGDNQSTEAQLRDIHAAGYFEALRAGVQTVMLSYSSWHGRKMHGHADLVTGVLKGRLGFDGFVVGDWNAHGQLPGCSNVSCALAINAGLDMFMAPDSWKELYENTLAQVKAGEISMERLDDAVRRILRVKLRAGLFEKGKPSSRPFAGQFDLLGAPEHREVARQAVRESLVLLKNQNQILPLAPKQNVLVAGDGANDVGKQSGGWTLTWQGTGTTNDMFPRAQTIYAGIEAAVRAAGGRVEFNPQGKFSRKPDVAIVVFGEDPYAEFQGDVLSVEYSPGNKRDLEILRSLKKQGIPVVSVFLSGRPLWVNPEINASDAFVAAWLPGSEGGGIADVLFRKPDGSIHYDFRGKLSFSWPRTPQQASVNRGDSEEPLFAYGYGLRYGENGDLPLLSEEGSAPDTTAIDPRSYFMKGKTGSGWNWVVGDRTTLRKLPGGAGAESGLRVTAIDRAAQEDARLVEWSGDAFGRAGLASDLPIDLSREANGQLSLGFDFNVRDAATRDVSVVVECGADCRGAIPITADLAAAGTGVWKHLKIPLSCFRNAGADMRRVTAPFLIASDGKLAISISNVGLETGLDGIKECPN
jgi:beta-glucosidase